MKRNLPIGLLGLGLGLATPAFAQPYFSCEHFPRCEAIQNAQCAPKRTLKDKLTLVRSHNSAEEVERTWAVLSALEPEYCSRLGGRGDIVREFSSFRTRATRILHDGGCADAQACAETFVKVTRERWERADLEARIKADIEARSRAAATEPAVPDGWQTTVEPATPARPRRRTVQTR
jgi:hypothetical protein